MRSSISERSLACHTPLISSGERLITPGRTSARPTIKGKFLYEGETKFYVRGVTYGTFRPDEDGNEFTNRETIFRDLAQIARNQFNAIRTYTLPPRWLLDAAQHHGLRVMVGLSWEQHLALLDEPRRIRSVEQRIRAGVSACAGHPAILCYAIGNEVPAPIARWHGGRSMERFIERLYRAAKAEDPQGLVTYVNYPSTEYLHLPFLDLFCYNVYLESQRAFQAYLARLHNLTGDRPLMVTEIGLDSRRNGEHTQARALDWQVRTAMASGCAGAFVFAWTDEWFRGGQEVGDWDFGLTTRRRQPKPALAAVQEAFTDAPFPRHMSWPRISVVVCTHNGGRTLPECLEGLRGLDYPNYEVIVVNDGSTDNSAVIASLSGYRLINTEHRGLSHARNAGLAVAEGEIVVYIDDDAFPDPDWLKYLAATFLSTSHAGVGGPNLPPLDDGPLAQCVANAPGGPMHVLLTDSEAEHIPGCNMAFRKCWLTEIGGFDPQFRVAGDDVDICWRLQERGLTIGFNPAALVWHRRRNSIRAYLRQQKGYGAAEALLQEKWPDKYNLLGQAIWSGRLYGKGLSRSIGLANRIYHGAWGSAPYQILQPPDSSVLRDVPAMPEWTLIILALGFLSVLGWLWPPLLLAVPLFALAVGITLYRADLSVAQAGFPLPVPSRFGAFGLRVLSVALHLMQPWARLWGRMFCGRQPEHSRTSPGLAWPLTRKAQIWSEQWQAPERLLKNLESAIREEAGVLVRGGDYDRWDLELRRGSLAAVRLYMTVEEHGAGRQMFRFRLSPYYTAVARMVVLPPTALAAAAAVDHAWTVTVILVALSIYATALALLQCGSAMAILKKVLQRQGVMQPARVVPSAGDGETAMKASRKTPASPIGEVTLQRPVV